MRYLDLRIKRAMLTATSLVAGWAALGAPHKWR